MDQPSKHYRYLRSDGWGHIFSGRRESTTRWILDRVKGELIAAQVESGFASSTWLDLNAAERADLLESLNDNQVADDPEAWDLFVSHTVPTWDAVPVDMRRDGLDTRERP
jgi:hypothetical protein